MRFTIVKIALIIMMIKNDYDIYSSGGSHENIEKEN
jgi:hypothetical protein